MKPLRLFISSVQNEFAVERETLRDYLPKSDKILGRVGPAKGGYREVLK